MMLLRDDFMLPRVYDPLDYGVPRIMRAFGIILD